MRIASYRDPAYTGPTGARVSSPTSPIQSSPAIGSPPPLSQQGTRSRGNTVSSSKISNLIGSIRRSGSRHNLNEPPNSPRGSEDVAADASAPATRHGGSSSGSGSSLLPSFGLGIRDLGGRSPIIRGRGGSFGASRKSDDDSYVPYNGPFELPPVSANIDFSSAGEAAAAAGGRTGSGLLPPIHGSFGPSISQQLQASGTFAPAPTSRHGLGDTSDLDAARRRSPSGAAFTSQRGTPHRESPYSYTPLSPPPSSPLPAIPSTPAFVFPRRQQPSASSSAAASPAVSQNETPRQSNPTTLAQVYSQPYTRPSDSTPKVAAPWSPLSPYSRPQSPREPSAGPEAAASSHQRRPSIGTGLPTAYVHSSANHSGLLDAAPYLPAALSFDRNPAQPQPPTDFSNLNQASFRPAIVGWAKPATTSYPISDQTDSREPVPSPAKSAGASRAPSSLDSNNSSDNLNASFSHPYERQTVGGHSAQTSMTSLRTNPSSGGAHAMSGKARSHGDTPSSQRHRRGELSSGQASSSSGVAMGWSDSGGVGSARRGHTPASEFSVSSEEAAALDLPTGPEGSTGLGEGPASMSVSAALASGRHPRAIASVPDLRVPAIVTAAPSVAEEQYGEIGHTEGQSTPELVEETVSPRTSHGVEREETAIAVRVETPSGVATLYENLAAHRPQAPLSPIPSSMASPGTERRLDGSSPSARDLSSNSGDRGTPQQSSRSNGSRTDSNVTSASPGRHSELARQRPFTETTDAPARTPSPQASDTWSSMERSAARAKYHLLQQLHLEELILHSVEYTGVLEPANGCEAVFRPKPPLRSRNSSGVRHIQLPSASERNSTSVSSGKDTHSTIAPLEAGFERHRARPNTRRTVSQQHRRIKTEGQEIDTDVPVNLEQLFDRDRWTGPAQAGEGRTSMRQPFFHHRMPPPPPTEANQPKTSSGPIRSAAAVVTAPAAWCAPADNISVGIPDGSEQAIAPPAPKFATLPIENRRTQSGNVEMVYRMTSVPVGTAGVAEGERTRHRKKSSRTRKEAATPELVHNASSPEVDDLATPDLPTVIAEGIWLDEQRAKWREQHRKSLDGSAVAIAWRRRSRSRSRSMSRSRNNSLTGAERPTIYETYRDRQQTSTRDDAALDPRGGVLANLQNKYKDREQPQARGRIARQAIHDDREYREQQRQQALRHSRSSPQLRRSAMLQEEAGHVPLPTAGAGAAAARSERRGLGLNQEADREADRSISPEIPTSFRPFARRRVASLGRESARKMAKEKTHQRQRSASHSPTRELNGEQARDPDFQNKRVRKLSAGTLRVLMGAFARKNRAPAAAQSAAQADKNRISAVSGTQMRVHRSSASWDRAVQTKEPVHLKSEERLGAYQTDIGMSKGSRSVVTDVPVVIATSDGKRQSYRKVPPPTDQGLYSFPPRRREGSDDSTYQTPGLALGSGPATTSAPSDLTTAGRHPTREGYHRPQDSNDLRAMLREAHRHDLEPLESQGDASHSLPAPPRRRGQSMSSDGRHQSSPGHESRVPASQQRTALMTQAFSTPVFAVPPTPQTVRPDSREDRSSSALSGSDPRATPASLAATSQSPQDNRSRSSADSYDTRPGSTAPREIWTMDSGTREDEDPQFQNLFFMPPRNDGSIPRSPYTRDARVMGTFAGSGLAMGLQEETHEQVDDEIADGEDHEALDEVAERMRPSDEDRFHQMGASRASSGISHQPAPRFSSSSSPRDDQPPGSAAGTRF
ncbi:hypothetical protein OC846_001104 [Tilletia horrida]|uniref:Uncharacterized protein n=1 Tax=Tilletia horrida TaxID=155126 RepID=A0AAN6K092_9BASI|nr:hypothetical protein OC846_001104 [Tilletia horrida]KAK0569323.1 hypothetical protein OC861_001036 [Tilletia horrida]